MVKSTRSCRTAPASACTRSLGGQQAVAAVAQHDAAEAASDTIRLVPPPITMMSQAAGARDASAATKASAFAVSA